MRLIGYIEGVEKAQVFGNYLYALGVDNQIERSQGDRWEVWIVSEDHLEQGKGELNAFQRDPEAGSYREVAEQAKEKRLKEALEREAYAQKVKERREIVRESPGISTGRLTMVLLCVCGVVYLFQWLGYENTLFRWLCVSRYKTGMPDVMHGEVWRLVTPIFMHGDILHIFFNLLWMRILGTIIEYRQGWQRLLGIVLATAVVSNVAQYLMSGPKFYGISGVVFGLLGYIWIKGRFDPFAGMHLPSGVVFMMLLWLALGVSGAIERGMGVHVANTAHVGGLVTGCFLGFLNSLRARGRRT